MYFLRHLCHDCTVSCDFKNVNSMVYPVKNSKTGIDWHSYAEQLVERVGILDEETAAVLVKALSHVHRDAFLSPEYAPYAAEDRVLPIGFDQVISRPSDVVRMLGLIGLRKGMRILEIGCGSGYVSAVMAAAGAQVFAVERIGLLAQQARKVLDGLGFSNVLIRMRDGQKGWQDCAPYDAIVVTTPFEFVEPELLAQLTNPGGRLVVAIGNNSAQTLTLWEAKESGSTFYQLESCSIER